MVEASAALNTADAVCAGCINFDRGGVPAVGAKRAADDLQRGGGCGFIHLDCQCVAGGQPGLVGAGAGDHIAGCIGGNDLFGGAGLDVADGVLSSCFKLDVCWCTSV